MKQQPVTKNNVLFIGIDFRHSRGGVPEVEKYYDDLFDGVKFVGTSVDGSKFKKAIWMLKGLPKFCWSLAVDKDIRIVHVHGCSDNSFWRKRIFINIAKRMGKKVVYHVHSGRFLDFASEHIDAVKDTVGKCDVVVALSENWKQAFSKVFPEARVEILHNGVYPIEEAPVRRERGGAVKMCFLGMINANKGVYDLVKAIALGKDEFSGRLRLNIAGQGEDERLKSLIEAEGVGDIVEHIGWVAGDSKRQLLRDSDIFVLPSHFEGLPVSVLEAMNYALPVIASKVGGIPDVVEDGVNGILVAPGDIDGFRRAISALVSHDDVRIGMGLSGREKIKDFYPREIKERLFQIYDGLGI